MNEVSYPNKRSFMMDDVEWTAHIAGESAAGTGAGSAHAYLVAVQFTRQGDAYPSREALLPRGRFEHLYDDELRELLKSARPLPPLGLPNDG